MKTRIKVQCIKIKVNRRTYLASSAEPYMFASLRSASHYPAAKMPNTTSAKKSLRQNEKRRKQNLQKKKRFKALKKEIKGFVRQGKIEEIKKLLPLFQKAVDKAAKTNTIHKNKASREKSRITKMLNALNAKS